MKKKTIGYSLAVLLLLIGGTVWALRSRADAQLNAVREMGKSLASGNERPSHEKMRELHNAMQKLTPQQRESLWDERRQAMDRREDQKLASFFALPPQQRNAFLDKEIMEEEKREKERAAWFAQAGQSQNRGGPPQAGQGRGLRPNANGGPRGPQHRTAEQQRQQRVKRLDSRTPQQRAQRSAYRAAVEKRRIELGLPAHSPHGPPGPPRR